MLDPVDVERDPADGDVAQEQAGRQPEQGRPERGERAGIDQLRIAAEVVDALDGPRQVGRPSGSASRDDLAVGQARQRLEGRGVGPQLAILIGVGDRNAGRDHSLDLVGPAIAEVDEVVAAGLGVLDRRLVAARGDLDELDASTISGRG